jgi:hypothetical protein
LGLEEAGAETIGTIAATLKPSDQRQFSAQVDELVTLGLAQRDENNLTISS